MDAVGLQVGVAIVQVGRLVADDVGVLVLLEGADEITRHGGGSELGQVRLVVLYFQIKIANNI